MLESVSGYFITWTTYGTWLPGDQRGWRLRAKGQKLPEPLLEAWCKEQMKGEAVLLRNEDRITVEEAIRCHCQFRGWDLKAVNARTNHVHVVVVSDKSPQKTRDELKANSTRMLRLQSNSLNVPKTWTAGGDCEVLGNDDELLGAMHYVIDCQSEPVGVSQKP
ncbi:MAG: transposase [Planctomycetota bacterium]|nr:transposase [Planctomycetota bacterium]